MEIPFMYLLCKIDYMDGCVSFTSNGEKSIFGDGNHVGNGLGEVFGADDTSWGGRYANLPPDINLPPKGVIGAGGYEYAHQYT